MRRGLIVWLAVFAVYAASLVFDAAPGQRYTADEVRVLLISRSIAKDGDVDLANQYRERQWRAFRTRPVLPRAAVLSGKQLLEPVGVGLPALVTPAYVVGGARGVQLFLAAMLALAVALAVALARRLVADPWATGTVVVLGLSPPMLAASTTISPEGLVAAILAGAAILALRLREETRTAWATWCAVLLALLPWIGLRFVVPGAVIALLMARWLRRRRRGLAGFVALELIFVSIVLYISIHDRLYGGWSPDSVLPPGQTGTGAHGLWEHLARAPRVLGLWLDPDAGLLWWAPAAAMALVGVWRLWRSRRDRLWKVAPEQVDVDVAAGLFTAVLIGGALSAVLLVPVLHGVWFAGHDVVAVFAFGAALAAWGAQRVPRVALVLFALTAVAAVWLLAAGVLAGDTGLDPPHGPLSPWDGLTGRLPAWPND